MKTVCRKRERYWLNMIIYINIWDILKFCSSRCGTIRWKSKFTMSSASLYINFISRFNKGNLWEIFLCSSLVSELETRRMDGWLRLERISILKNFPQISSTRNMQCIILNTEYSLEKTKLWAHKEAWNPIEKYSQMNSLKGLIVGNKMRSWINM